MFSQPESVQDNMPRHVLRELGFAVRSAGDGLIGEAPVTPQAHVPGTAHLRTSVLAAWADMLAGLLAMRAFEPGVPVTVELDVHLYSPAPASGVILGTSRTVKAGRSVFVAAIDFTDGDGRPVALAGGSFMAAPDRTLRAPSATSIDEPAPAVLLSVPLAERAGCTRAEPGVAVLPRSDDGLNASRTVNGGLIALAAEEAVLSLAPGGTLSSLGLRYLQPARVGPVVASARIRDGLASAELRDAGNGDRLCVTATARTWPARAEK
jgi:acyl-coenzyme A thioesterase PaaI-like protein